MFVATFLLLDFEVVRRFDFAQRPMVTERSRSDNAQRPFNQLVAGSQQPTAFLSHIMENISYIVVFFEFFDECFYLFGLFGC